jgi:hypothetical protein
MKKKFKITKKDLTKAFIMISLKNGENKIFFLKILLKSIEIQLHQIPKDQQKEKIIHIERS